MASEPESVAQLKAAFGNSEPLHEDLEACLILPGEGSPCRDYAVLKHPLVYAVPYLPGMNGFLNKQYEAKQRCVRQAVADRNAQQLVSMHERPYRFDALKIAAHWNRVGLVPDSEFWPLVAWAYADSENVYENRDGWVSLLKECPDRDTLLIPAEDRKEFAELPETITVFRGASLEHENPKGRHFHLGISWSLSKRIAAFFAKRFESEGLIITANISKNDALLFGNWRREAEVVIDRALEIVNVEFLRERES